MTLISVETTDNQNLDYMGAEYIYIYMYVYTQIIKYYLCLLLSSLCYSTIFSFFLTRKEISWEED